MRQVHAAGEQLFVDYAGRTVALVDGSTGELRTAQVFVAVLGASNYTYAEASWTLSLAGLDRLARAHAGISGWRAAFHFVLGGRGGDELGDSLVDIVPDF